MDIKSILRSKFTTFGLAVILLMVLIFSSQLFLQKFEVEKEIASLQKKSDEVSQDNSQLSELIKYYKTDDYAERAARDKLNLKKEGEFVVSLPANLDDTSAADSQQEKTNPQKWYDYFF